MTWVVVSDPIPGGATVLGTRSRARLAARDERRDSAQGWAWPAYEEKGFEAYRSYYRFVPKGKFSTEYTVRLNNVGHVRPAADARRGDVRAGDVRRGAERGGEVKP